MVVYAARHCKVSRKVAVRKRVKICSGQQSSSEASARKSLIGQGSSLIELASSALHWAGAQDPNSPESLPS